MRRFRGAPSLAGMGGRVVEARGFAPRQEIIYLLMPLESIWSESLSSELKKMAKIRNRILYRMSLT